jgi:hypothetical protein
VKTSKLKFQVESLAFVNLKNKSLWRSLLGEGNRENNCSSRADVFTQPGPKAEYSAPPVFRRTVNWSQTVALRRTIVPLKIINSDVSVLRRDVVKAAGVGFAAVLLGPMAANAARRRRAGC